jgi:cell division protein ZapA
VSSAFFGGCMTVSTESVRVTIYGDEYSIKGDADSETTKKVAEYVNLKMSEVQKSIASRDKVKVAVLSAMNIAGELLGYKEKCQEYLDISEEMRKKAVALGQRIDHHIENL